MRATGTRYLGLGLQTRWPCPQRLTGDMPSYSQCGEVGHVAEGVIGQHADAVVAQVTRGETERPFDTVSSTSGSPQLTITRVWHLSTNPFIHTHTHSSIYPRTHLSIHPPTYTCSPPHTHLYTYPFSHLSTHFLICPLIPLPSIHLPTHTLIQIFIFLFALSLPTHSSIYLLIP